jgi:hypothetical protein
MIEEVNHPPHYAKGGVECIQAIKASMTPEAFHGYLKGNIIKYLWRYENKGKAVQDLEKANWYLKELIEETKVAKPLTPRDEKPVFVLSGINPKSWYGGVYPGALTTQINSKDVILGC